MLQIYLDKENLNLEFYHKRVNAIFCQKKGSEDWFILQSTFLDARPFWKQP